MPTILANNGAGIANGHSSNGVESTNGTSTATSTTASITNGGSSAVGASLSDFSLNLNLSKEQQKQILNSVKLNDPPSLLKELLKHRHNSLHVNSNGSKPHHRKSSHTHVSLKHKFNCYSGNTADLDDEEDEDDIDAQIDKLDLTTPTTNGGAASAAAVNEQDVNNNFNLLNQAMSLNSNSTPIKTPSSTNKRSTTAKANASLDYGDSSKRKNGRNLIKILNEENNATKNDNVNSSQSQSQSDLIYLNNSLLNSLLASSSIILFESPIKRKCIIKNYRKPRFSQWKSYWLQLVGGNLLIYYPSKTIMFNRDTGSHSRRNSTNNAEQPSAEAQLTNSSTFASTNLNELSTGDESISSLVWQQSAAHTQLLQSSQQSRKVFYHKNPCKMHPIASWMIVNLFQDKEEEILAAQSAAMCDSASANNPASQNSSMSSNGVHNAPNHTKFDIQLNDLNNGNMYKYRFDCLELAKEWYEQFKLASTYHERQKPDNLIRFD